MFEIAKFFEIANSFIPCAGKNDLSNRFLKLPKNLQTGTGTPNVRAY
jgi:hypothetical protein